MSLAERQNPDACSACQNSSESAFYSDDGLCSGCHNVFRAARVLLKRDIAAEEELIPTLVFARIAGRAEDPHFKHHYSSGYGEANETILFGNHPALEIVKFVDRVPVVKVKPFALSAERHAETQILKSVRIRTLSKRVKSPDVAKSYEQLLKQEGARWDENNHGTLSYDCLFGYLELVVTEGTQLSPNLVEGLGEDIFRHPTFQFPSPEIVERAHEAMQKTFADRLDLYGKRAKPPTAEKLVPAFAAWHVGSGADEKVPPTSRHRVSTILNRHLLEPCGLTHLGEDASNPAETIWRDVERHWWRFINIQQYAFYHSHRS